jgi:hypothetical protein
MVYGCVRIKEGVNTAANIGQKPTLGMLAMSQQTDRTRCASPRETLIVFRSADI